jgi:RHS repeat-associated protein
VLRVRGNAAEVPGTYVPWLPFAPSTSPGEQSIKAQNRLGGSAEARGRASGPSWSATLDCYWGSSTSTGCSRRVDGTTRYLLDGLSVIAQYAPTGERQAWYTQSLARIDEVLNVANDSGKLWYQTDALGSVYGLTNQAGSLVGNQNYDVFGAPTPAPSGPAGQPFGFTGREHELDSGLVYARARYSNPAAGRWLSEDPINLRTAQLPHGAERWMSHSGYGLAQMLANNPLLQGRYLYANGNPTRFSDPVGEVIGDTVSGTLSIGALVIAAVSEATMMLGLMLFVVGYAVDDIGLQRDSIEIVQAAALAMVASLAIATVLNPYLMVAYLQTYWVIGATILYLGCMGLFAVKWYNGGCKLRGVTPGVYCTLALFAALRQGNVNPLLRWPQGI